MAGTIAALFVETNGIYFNVPGIDPWDVTRDARFYPGPYPVIAHPPCQRWGRYWSGGPNPKAPRRDKGDDNGCFYTALAMVREFSGVIEHPEASHAWPWFGLNKPPRKGGWVPAGDGGYTCCVEQGHYGHRARKATWLYTYGIKNLPELIWGPCTGKTRLDPGFHSKAERAEYTGRPIKRTSPKDNLATPVQFRDLLINLVRGDNG